MLLPQPFPCMIIQPLAPKPEGCGTVPPDNSGAASTMTALKGLKAPQGVVATN